MFKNAYFQLSINDQNIENISFFFEILHRNIT